MEDSNYEYQLDMIISNKKTLEFFIYFEQIINNYINCDGNKVKSLISNDCKYIYDQVLADVKQKSAFGMFSSRLDKLGVFTYLTTTYGYGITSYAWEKFRFYKVANKSLYFLQENTANIKELKLALFNFENYQNDGFYINIYSGLKINNLSQSQLSRPSALSKTAILLIGEVDIQQLNFNNEGEIKHIPDEKQSYQWTYQGKYRITKQLAKEKIIQSISQFKQLYSKDKEDDQSLLRCIIQQLSQHKLRLTEVNLILNSNQQNIKMIKISTKVNSYKFKQDTDKQNKDYLDLLQSDYQEMKYEQQILISEYPIMQTDELNLYYKASINGKDYILVQNRDCEERRDLVVEHCKSNLISLKIIDEYNKDNNYIFNNPLEIITVSIGHKIFIKRPIITIRNNCLEDQDIQKHIEALKRFSFLRLQGQGIVCLLKNNSIIDNDLNAFYPEFHCKELYSDLSTNQGEAKIQSELEQLKLQYPSDKELDKLQKDMYVKQIPQEDCNNISKE